MKDIQDFFEDIPSFHNYQLKFVDKPNLTSIYHSHNFYEFVIILNGSAVLFINDHEYHLKKGESMCLCPNDKHKFISLSEGTVALDFSAKSNEFVNAAAVFNFIADKNKYSKYVYHLEKFDEIYRHALICSTSNDANNYKMLLCLIMFNLTNNNQNEFAYEQLNSTFTEMHKLKNMRDGINAMMRISGYSRSQLYRMVNRCTGMSVNEYLTNLRMTTANKYVLYSDKSLEEISEMVGYKSFSHFNKLFKNQFGISPAQLRKKRF